MLYRTSVVPVRFYCCFVEIFRRLTKASEGLAEASWSLAEASWSMAGAFLGWLGPLGAGWVLLGMARASGGYPGPLESSLGPLGGQLGPLGCKEIGFWLCHSDIRSSNAESHSILMFERNKSDSGLTKDAFLCLL